MQRSWLIAALALAAILAVLQHEALENLWYWRYTWFDTLMHFLGGAALAAFFVALAGPGRKALAFLAAMVAIALGWEVFELLIHQEREANFAFDTSLDILMDALGMSVAYVLARLTLWRSA